MESSLPIPGDNCQYCGNPIARSTLLFSHRRRANQVQCRVRLCSTCGDRVEYHLHIALSNLLELGPAGA